MTSPTTNTAAAGLQGTNDVLEAMRRELDAIDATLLQTIKARLDCCARIGHHKKAHAVPMMQPHRIGIVQARAAEFAAAHGVSGPFLRELYELIIAETCRIEDAIIDG
jgi:chorismate mutase